jgi:hypothetical protein
MQIEVDEIGVEKIRRMEFFVCKVLSSNLHFGDYIFVTSLGKKRGARQKWLVLDPDNFGGKKAYVDVYTTEEMKLLYCSVKNDNGSQVKAQEDVAYRFLVRSGKLRMKIKEGCTGCRRFWDDGSAMSQCSKCNRCRACCSKKSVPYSCAAHHLQEMKKTKRSHYRQQ